MITLTDYWMGRDKAYASSLTPEIRDNAVTTVHLVSALLAEAAADGVTPGIDEHTGTAVASGWRPPEVNARTSNAGAKSTHLTAEGCDLQDTKDRSLARWCLRNLRVLERLGLWMEDPRWTPDWVHLQTRPPGSGKRVYIPSAKPPLAKPLPEQKP